MKRLFVIVAAMTLLLAGTTEARTVRADVVIAPTGTCMIRAGGGIGCFGEAVPAQYTDGYIWIRRKGLARLAEAGGTLAPVTGAPMKLRHGDRWNKRGITCVFRRGMKCWNGMHGFRITKATYRIW